MLFRSVAIRGQLKQPGVLEAQVRRMVADARRQSLEEVVPGEEDRAFYRHPVHQRMVVMLGGPTMNLLLAFVLFAIVLVGIGIPQPTTQVDTIAVCTPTLGTDASGAPVLVYEPLPSGECPTGTTASPASTAGLRPGDTIVAVGTADDIARKFAELADGLLAPAAVQRMIDDVMTLDRRANISGLLAPLIAL